MKHIKILLLVLLMFSLFTIQSLAEEKTENSEATISFVADDESKTDPKDPDNPDLPGTGPGTGMTGKLTLDYLPSLDFGSNSITFQVQTFNTTNVKPYIQVTDKRATGEGWKVQAKSSDFTGTSGSFQGVITFKNASNVTVTGNTATAPTAVNPVTLTSGAAETNVVVASSGGNTGMGTWLTRWYPSEGFEGSGNDSVTLSVDTTNMIAGSYTATLDWILTDAP